MGLWGPLLKVQCFISFAGVVARTISSFRTYVPLFSLVEGEGQGGADKSLEVGGEKKPFFLEKGGLGDAKNMFNLPKKGLLIVR
jgi:hypothetical protein